MFSFIFLSSNLAVVLPEKSYNKMNLKTVKAIGQQSPASTIRDESHLTCSCR